MKNSAKEKVAIRSSACAVFTLGLLLAPVPARCGDGPAKPTVNHSPGNYGYINPFPWVCGIAGTDNRWAAHRGHDSRYLRISHDPQGPPQNRHQSMSIYCSNLPHHVVCPTDKNCARTPDRDGPHFVTLNFAFDASLPPLSETRPKRHPLSPWLKKNAKMPLLVGLWSKFLADGPPPEAPDAPPESAYAVSQEMEHYPQADVKPGLSSYTLALRGVQAAELIRKLHRAENVSWADDETGQSSFLVTVDEGLREQIGILMEYCGFDTAPAP